MRVRYERSRCVRAPFEKRAACESGSEIIRACVHRSGGELRASPVRTSAVRAGTFRKASCVRVRFENLPCVRAPFRKRASCESGSEIIRACGHRSGGELRASPVRTSAVRAGTYRKASCVRVRLENLPCVRAPFRKRAACESGSEIIRACGHLSQSELRASPVRKSSVRTGTFQKASCVRVRFGNHPCVRAPFRKRAACESGSEIIRACGHRSGGELRASPVRTSAVRAGTFPKASCVRVRFVNAPCVWAPVRRRPACESGSKNFRACGHLSESELRASPVGSDFAASVLRRTRRPNESCVRVPIRAIACVRVPGRGEPSDTAGPCGQTGAGPVRCVGVLVRKAGVPQPRRFRIYKG